MKTYHCECGEKFSLPPDKAGPFESGVLIHRCENCRKYVIDGRVWEEMNR